MLEEQNRTRKSLQKNLYFSVLQHTHNICFIIGHFYSPGSIQWKNEILEKVPVKLKILHSAHFRSKILYMGLAEWLQCQQIIQQKSQGQHLNQESFVRYRLSGNLDMLFKRVADNLWDTKLEKWTQNVFSAFWQAYIHFGQTLCQCSITHCK